MNFLGGADSRRRAPVQGRSRNPQLGLDGPSRTVIVEPLRETQPAPEPHVEPEPAPVPERERDDEKVPA